MNDLACALAQAGLLSGWQADVTFPSLTADAFVDYPLLLEYDTGTEDRGAANKFPQIQKKFQGYQKLFQSGWNCNGTFPAVIFVSEDAKRVGPLRKLSVGYTIQILVIHKFNFQVLLDRIKTLGHKSRGSMAFFTQSHLPQVVVWGTW